MKKTYTKTIRPIPLIHLMRKSLHKLKKDGINQEWITAAQNSPVYKLAIEYKMAFPLHPEFRTMPMVRYCPP